MPANPSLVPASAGQRLGSKLIDAVPLAVLAVVFWQLSTADASAGGTGATSGLPVEMLIFVGAAFVAYSLWLWGWEAARGNTPGNAMLGLRTSNLDGLPAGWVAVFLRGLIVAVGFAVLVVGAVIVLISNLWDRNDRRQGWHDKIARTYMFDVRAGRNPLQTGGIAAVEPARATEPLDDGAAVLAVPGTHEPIAEVPGVPPSESVPAHPDDELEATRVRSRTGRNGVRIRFDDGRDVALADEALIGRDPAARMGETIGQLIDFHDQGRSVSKTHLHLRVEGATVWVTDRNSTNGSAVTAADGQRRSLAAEEQVLAAPGSTVHFGDRSFTVENV
ncbi:RDD family protein [Arthrobacter monumenti]